MRNDNEEIERMRGRFCYYSHQLLDKIGEIPACDRDGLDAAANNIAIRYRNYVSHAITSIHNHPRHFQLHSAPDILQPAKARTFSNVRTEIF